MKLQTQQDYTKWVYILGMAIPLITGWLFYIEFLPRFIALPIAVFTLVIGFYLLVQRIRYQWRDSKAFDMLSSSASGLSAYEVQDRLFFIDDIALECYKDMAANNGLRLEINKERNKATVNKSHLAAYRRGSDKI